jgi:alkylhydroperoxidase family enzyme
MAAHVVATNAVVEPVDSDVREAGVAIPIRSDWGMARISPVEEPYEPEVAERLKAMMPGDQPPIALFRTFVRNLPMAKAMGPWGGYELGRRLSLTLRDREIVIDRATARCRCEYEWGVHVALFSDAAALTREQVGSLTHGSADDDCWTDDRDRLLVEAVDQLHDSGTIDDALWARLAEVLTTEQLLDLPMLIGWYHSISFTANSAGVERETFAPSFGDYRSE